MGLDDLELIMALEEEFSVALSDEEARGALTTVGATVDTIYARLRQSEDGPCPSQQAFYQIRKILMEQLGVARHEIRPDTTLDSIFPKPGRPENWNTTFTAHDGIEHLLKRSRPLNSLINLIIPGTMFAASTIWLPVWAGCLIAIGCMWAGNRLTRSLRIEFRGKMTTVKDLVPYIKTSDMQVWTRSAVLHTVRAVATEQLGVTPDHLTEDAHWYNDIGLG